VAYIVIYLITRTVH